MASPYMSGRATLDGTSRAVRRFGAVARRLGRTELMVTPVGFGGYRIHPESPLHRQALEEAMRAGVNLVDTSANYTEGGSERLIGEVLTTLVAQEVIRRDEIVVVTKAGYLQGAALEAVLGGRAPRPPEVVEYQPTCWHCLHPSFLASELEESRARLGLATIDVVLLHNPEYYLVDRRNRTGEVTDEDRVELLRRIAAAFAFFEEEVKRGTIGAYGVSCNTFPAPSDEPTQLSLEGLIAAARAVAEDHHFAVIQTPLNLYETGALQPRQVSGEGLRSVLDIAAAVDLGVLTNRPLTAFIYGDEPRVIRLTDVEHRDGARSQDSDALLRAVCELEDQWREGLGKELAASSGDSRFVDLFRWGRELSSGATTIRDLGHWMQLRNGVIATHMGQLGGILLASLEGDALLRFRSFWDEYGVSLGAALDGVEDGFRSRARAVADMISDRLAPSLPAEALGLGLSQRAVLTLLGAPISCVLVGMRKPAYVHDMRDLGPTIEGLQEGAEPRLTIDLEALVRAFAPAKPLH